MPHDFFSRIISDIQSVFFTGKSGKIPEPFIGLLYSMSPIRFLYRGIQVLPVLAFFQDSALINRNLGIYQTFIWIAG